MALSRKENEVVPNERVDCSRCFADRSTGSREGFRIQAEQQIIASK